MSDEKPQTIPVSIAGTDAELEIKKISKARRKGADLSAIAEELSVCPFEILLYAASGNWEGLGYTSGTRTVPTKDGSTFEVDILSPELRLQAAKEAAQYLFPKKRSVEVSGAPDAEPINFKFDGNIVELIKLARG